MFQKNLNLFLTILKRNKHDWTQPIGHDTGIKIYNCITKTKVPLIVRNKNQTTWYTCGPTVYNSAHLGHASSYIKLDIIQRILKRYFKLNLVTAMNITDIDDKIIKRSQELDVPVPELVRKYENEFWNELEGLNVTKPDIIIRVTEYMNSIIQLVETLLAGGKAYRAPDGIYFNLPKHKDLYGKLVQITIENDASNDFALWKYAKPNEPFWDTNLGQGRPGWHTECACIASNLFGNYIDIHAGGLDLKFPHHENEEIVSCSHHGIKQWVQYWLHTGHLNVGETKMSKSLNNFISIKELLDRNQSEPFRMACVLSNYKSQMEYSEEMLQNAESQLKKFQSFLEQCNAYLTEMNINANINQNELYECLTKSKIDIDTALKDDFNTARVIKNLIELVSVTNKMFHSTSTTPASEPKQYAIIASVANFVREQFDMFGFRSFGCSSTQLNANMDSNITNILIGFRDDVRKVALQTKDQTLLKYCDRVRDELKTSGIEIKDRVALKSITKSN